mgnify:FL=1|tara:strand:- start:960 stop:1106 length:147 start_codon:yes stop_codon:yes gene_type:complete
MKFIKDLIELYIPNALFRVKLFFNPELKAEIEEFIAAIERSVEELESD